MSILYMIDFFAREELYADNDNKRNAGKSRKTDSL